MTHDLLLRGDLVLEDRVVTGGAAGRHRGTDLGRPGSRRPAPGRGGDPRPLGPLADARRRRHARPRGQLRDRGPHEHDGERGVRRGHDDRRHALRPAPRPSWGASGSTRRSARSPSGRSSTSASTGRCPRSTASGCCRAHRGRRVRVQVLAVRVRRAAVPADRRRRPAGGVRDARGRRGPRRRAQRAAGGGRAPARVAARRSRGRCARARRVAPAVSENAASAKLLDFAYWTGAPAPRPLHPPAHVPARRVLPRAGSVGVGRDLRALPAPERDGRRAVRVDREGQPADPRRDRPRGAVDAPAGGRIESVSTDHAPWPMEHEATPDAAARRRACPGWRASWPASSRQGWQRDFPLARPARLRDVAARRDLRARGSQGTPRRWAWTPTSRCSMPALRGRSARPTRRRRSDWSPFDGRSFAGRVEATYCRGRRAFQDGRVVGPAGSGAWLPRH